MRFKPVALLLTLVGVGFCVIRPAAADPASEKALADLLAPKFEVSPSIRIVDQKDFSGVVRQLSIDDAKSLVFNVEIFRQYPPDIGDDMGQTERNRNEVIYGGQLRIGSAELTDAGFTVTQVPGKNPSDKAVRITKGNNNFDGKALNNSVRSAFFTAYNKSQGVPTDISDRGINPQLGKWLSSSMTTMAQALGFTNQPGYSPLYLRLQASFVKTSANSR